MASEEEGALSPMGADSVPRQGLPLPVEGNTMPEDAARQTAHLPVSQAGARAPVCRVALSLCVLVAILLTAAACWNEEAPVRDDIAMAEDALNRRDIDDAQMYFERYLRKNPEGARRWQVWQQLLSITLDMRLDKVRARQYLEVMLLEYDAAPEKRRSIQLPLARLCRDTQEYERAAVLWESLAKDPQTPDSLKAGVCIELAKIYLRRLEFTAATEILRLCTQLRVDVARKANCLFALGEAQVFTESLEAAEATLRATIALEAIPEELRTLVVFTLADVLEQQGRFPAAIALFESIRATYPNEAVMEMRLARLKKVNK